jgi:hypothetical protein
MAGKFFTPAAESCIFKSILRPIKPAPAMGNLPHDRAFSMLCRFPVFWQLSQP